MLIFAVHYTYQSIKYTKNIKAIGPDEARKEFFKQFGSYSRSSPPVVLKIKLKRGLG